MSVVPAGLGYIFYPFEHGFSLGYAQLDVYLGEGGKQEGFVPAEVHVCTWDNGGVFDGGAGMGRTTITAHASGEATHFVAPGFITVTGRNGDGELEVYCFGGRLTCRLEQGAVLCRLTSSAPIFNLSEEGLDWSENSVLRVVDGLESEIAGLRAQFDDAAEIAFDLRLAQTDPRLLYVAGLELAYRSFQALPEVLRTEHYWDEYGILVRALEEAKQAAWWPADRSLAAVLGRGAEQSGQ